MPAPQPLPDPFYVRPPDYRYEFRTNPAYGWQAGTAADGSQVLRCGTTWLAFDPDGVLRRVSDESVPLAGGAIAVRRFWLPDRWIGIEDLPDVLAAFYTAPGEFEMRPEDVAGWVAAGQFVFYPGWGEYVLGPGGRVVSS